MQSVTLTPEQEDAFRKSWSETERNNSLTMIQSEGLAGEVEKIQKQAFEAGWQAGLASSEVTKE